MQLVGAMQAYAGPIEAWPTSLLQVLFAYDLKHRDYLLHLQQIISFFYGNDVPLNLACQFFSACAFLPISWIAPRFKYHYELFQSLPSQSRCPYYDVSEGRVRYTDGTTDGVHARLPVTIGFESTGFPTMINCILMHAQQYEYDESAVY